MRRGVNHNDDDDDADDGDGDDDDDDDDDVDDSCSESWCNLVHIFIRWLFIF